MRVHCQVCSIVQYSVHVPTSNTTLTLRTLAPCGHCTRLGVFGRCFPGVTSKKNTLSFLGGSNEKLKGSACTADASTTTSSQRQDFLPLGYAPPEPSRRPLRRLPTGAMPAPAPFPAVKRQLLVSDFDESFSDADTDRWTFEVLSPRLRRKFQDTNEAGTMQFTDLCASLLRELHAEEKSTPADILGAQRQLHVHPAMVRGARNLKSRGTECFLLSNSNEVYLKTVLEVRDAGEQGPRACSARARDVSDDIVVASVESR